MKLVESDKIDEKEFSLFIKEFKTASEKLVPYSLDQKDMDFKNYIKSLQDESLGIGLRENWVPASTFFMIDDQNKIHGAANIRHKLTEDLKMIGGHVGFGIRPSSRKQGYGKQILRMSLDILLQMNIKKILVTCDKKNTPSAKVIINNGGILDSEVEIDNVWVQRYWIFL